MKIVYIISAYKYPVQLLRLVQKLDGRDIVFLIHIDMKTDPDVFDVIWQALSPFENVVLLDRHACYWGDFGHVLATLKGIQTIYHEKIDFDYVILMTGQCYPIKSNSEISQFLENHAGKSFMDYSLVSSYHQLKRVERWNLRLFSRFYLPLPNKYLPLPIKRPLSQKLGPFFKGSSYWCLSKPCIEYIHDFIIGDNLESRQFINFFQGVYIPDEMFFQTLLLNSPLKDHIVNENLWHIHWPAGAYAPHPSILETSHFPTLAASSKLFARKFDMTHDAKILAMLDELPERGVEDSGAPLCC